MADADARTVVQPSAIGGYRIVGELGRGGMGIVYRAEHLGLRREVALKVLDPALARDQVARERFLREARALAAICDRHVVTCHDAGWSDPYLYLAMELQRGGDAWGRVRRDGPLPLAEAMRIAEEAALGVAAIHRAGLVHRDLKPANLFLAEDGTVRVADLGLATATAGSSLTSTGMVVGTPSYLAPEQAAGGLPIDHRTDIYGLGATLYALLTAQPPFRGESAFAVVAQVLRDEPPDARAARPEVPADVADLIRRAMARDPRRRPRDAAAFAAQCARLRGPVERRRRPALARPAVVAVTTAAMIVVAVTGVTVARVAAPQRSATPLRHASESPSSDERAAPAPPPLAAPAVVETTPPPTAAPVAAAPPPAAATPPSWSRAAGLDDHGRWCEVAVGDATLRLRWCPAGSFRMGSPEDEPSRYGNERAHVVTLTRGFWLMDREVSRALWNAVTGDAVAGDADLPVDHVSWDDCGRFTARLAARVAPARPRLPTEAEWEYACRAGGGERGGGWFRDHGGGVAHAVGASTPNAWGLHDMLGNVWEWCQDGYGDLADAGDATDPVGDGQRRVIRGGSFRYAAAACRPALRDAAAPGLRRDSVGVRIAFDDAP